MRYKLALLLIVLSLAARLPFLMSSASFFDSDEAIEGLMARHVLHGELPIFYWGQGYKGVPEVYLAAAVFAIAGSSVVALKSVTLFLFALWVGLNFILLDELFTRRTAFLGSLLLIAGPPALVFWSLSANAEFILTMLSGTLLLLLFQQWEKSHSAKIAILLSFTLGVAWWIHQLIIYYVLPVALILLLRSQWWKRNRSLKLVSDVLLARWIPLLPRLFLCALNIAAVSYSGLYALAFFTGGFSAHIAAVDISAHNPQKMLRVAIALLGLSICLWIAITHRLKILGLLRKWFWIPIAFIITD